MPSKWIHPTEHVQELICPPPTPSITPQFSQRARLCLKLKDISVGEDRPHATEGLSGLRLATRFRYRSIADAQRMYRKPQRDGCRVVLKRASYLLLRVTPADCTEADQTQRWIRGVLRQQEETTQVRERGPCVHLPVARTPTGRVRIFTQCGCIVLQQLIISRPQSADFIAFPALLIKKKYIGSLRAGLTGAHWPVPWT